MFSWLFSTIGSIIVGVAKFYIEEVVIPSVIGISNKIVYNCLGVGF